MQSQPKISIGLPVYNAEEFLSETIESILKQDYVDFELIISDNASTDNTSRICQRYQELDTRVRYYRSDVNRGAAWNFNRVFNLARGEFYKWQAHDDVCLPNFLSSCLREFEHSSASLILVYPRPQTIDEHGKKLDRFLEKSIATSDARPHRRLSMVLRNITMASAFYGLSRRSQLCRTRLHGRFIAADYVLLAELSILGELREIPDTLFLRRVHPNISTYANRAATDLLRWFDTSNSRKRILLPPHAWVGVELFRSIHHLNFPLQDKILCCTTVIFVWYWRLFRNFAGKHRRRLAEMLKSTFSHSARI